MLANKSRVWMAGTMLLCVLLAVASWFMLIGPKRAQAAELEVLAVDVQSQNSQLESRIAQLKVQFAELPQRQAELAVIKQAMPEETALPTLVRDLDAIAAASGVTLMTLSPGVPVTVPTAVAVAPVPADGTAPAEGAAPAEGDAAASPDVTATAVPAGDVLVSIPTSMVIVGDFFESELFLKKLQAEIPRAFLVQTLTIQAETVPAEAAGGKPATANGDVTMTVAGSVFVLRSASAAPLVTGVLDPAASPPPATAEVPIAPPAAPPAGEAAN